jgi:hypothetical protein
MIDETYDIYAEANPAFVAYLIQRYVKKHYAAAEDFPHISLVYVAIPLGMSGKLEPTFDSTNSRTGLLAWLSRFPEVRIGLSENIIASHGIIADGLKAAVLSRLIKVNEQGYLELGESKGPPESLKASLPDGPKAIASRVERLGTWIGKTGSPAAVFSALEVNP